MLHLLVEPRNVFSSSINNSCLICDAGCSPSGHIGKYLQQKGHQVIGDVRSKFRCLYCISLLTVEAMADSQGLKLVARKSTAGGAHLGQHWNYEKDLTTRDKIRQGSYDFVVLQDHSLRAIQYPDSLMHYGKLFGGLIKEKSAEGILYMTWAREWDPFMQETITAK